MRSARRAVTRTSGTTAPQRDRWWERSRQRSGGATAKSAARRVAAEDFATRVEFAVAPGTSDGVQIGGSRPKTGPNVLLVILLVPLGAGLLYAYRSQTPSIQTVSVTQAILQVQAGQVKTVRIVGTRATLELANGSSEQTTLAQQDQLLAKATVDYNATNPAEKVDLSDENENRTFPILGSILLSLLPVLLIAALVLYVLRTRQS